MRQPRTGSTIAAKEAARDPAPEAPVCCSTDGVAEVVESSPPRAPVATAPDDVAGLDENMVMVACEVICVAEKLELDAEEAVEEIEYLEEVEALAALDEPGLAEPPTAPPAASHDEGQHEVALPG